MNAVRLGAFWFLACTMQLHAQEPPAAGASDAAAAASQSASAIASSEASNRSSFWLTPHIEGLDVCDAALADVSLNTMAKVRRVCEGLGGSSAQSLRGALDALEPGGAHGKVQVGYTLTLPLLGSFRAEGDDWVIDDAKLKPLLDLVEQVERPVVIYLSSSHFDTIGPLPEALRKDPRNFMQYADGSTPQLGYFGFPIAAYTLLTDADIPVNRYRVKALREITERVKGLSDAARARIVGFTLGGELHHLYPDFEQGAGRFDQVKVTDYSPQSIAAFRVWLAEKWGSVRKLSAATGMAFEDFDHIDAPRGNLLDGTAKRLREHYTAYAAGHVPIAGWLHDPKNRVEMLTLYVNGKPLGEVQRGYNRLDVYRAREDVKTPNVGYRYDLDVGQLAPGKYLAQVVARVDGLNYELAQAKFTLAARKAGGLRERSPESARKLQVVESGNWLQRWWRIFMRTIGVDRSTPSYARVPDVDSHLDLPAKDLVVQYNPMAREWDEFRNAQVLGYMQYLYDEAVDAGLPENDLYSHQINDRINSSWNAQLFAVDDVWRERQDWRAGMKLYGGGTNSDIVMRLIRRNRLTDFASPEFNPQQWKTPDAALAAMKAQRDAGARFVSPYYVGLMPKQLRAGQTEHGVNRMEMGPNNPKDGSDQFYRAVQEMALE